MSELLRYMQTLIEKRGPLSIADYMELTLQHPEFGYYRHGDPLGKEGDFVTAPEISQMFGEMVGLWCAEIWKQMGRPAEFVLLELGPGRGTLLADALRATAKISGFQQALRLHLLESNATLRQTQQQKLAAYSPVYISDASQLAAMPVLAIANEFFDALPVRQFEKTFHGWAERLVEMESGKLSFATRPVDAVHALLIPKDLQDANPGTVYEVSLPSLATMRDLGGHVARHGGAALIIDYGYIQISGRPTLQAVHNHAYVGVLDRPGETDITAHVDFGALKAAATHGGAHVSGPLGQGDFLRALGVELRAAQLKKTASPAQAVAIDSALHRLTSGDEMGSLFKVMAIAAPGSTTPPAF
ncbi:MAG: SAM-dependent methyltransferase [Pseudomonadota bacterium]|nr:SAM-dependent methyltransferase [Pseudomonadota bacterium]